MKPVSKRELNGIAKRMIRFSTIIEKLDSAIRLAGKDPIPLGRSVRFTLPDDSEIHIYIWEENDKRVSSVEVLNSNSSVHLGENAIGMTWGKGENDSDIRFEEIKIPRHVCGMYFGKGKLSYVKRLKRKGRALKT